MNSINKFEDLAIELAQPRSFQDPIKIGNHDKSLIKLIFRKMFLIREVENKLAKEKELGKIKGPIHLAAGQEAIPVGISENLRDSDRVFGAHRSHSHLLALDECVKPLFAEILGKNTGLSKGMGGSMHLTNPKKGFIGSVPIVAGTVPLAVGASFDAMYRGSDDIGVAYLGDGAIEEGIVHESLNLSKQLNTPTLFVLENNLFSSHMHISQRQPMFSSSRFAVANDIEAVLLDGNDPVQIYESSKLLIEKIRKGDGPKFIEAVTFRHYGHVDWRKDIDVGVNRSAEDLDDWLKRDPISRLEISMLKNNIFSSASLNEFKLEIKI